MLALFRCRTAHHLPDSVLPEDGGSLARNVLAFQVVPGRQPRPGAQQGVGFLAEAAACIHNEGDEASVVEVSTSGSCGLSARGSRGPR